MLLNGDLGRIRLESLEELALALGFVRVLRLSAELLA